MQMVETDEAGHRGRVQFIHSHVDHAGNLDIYTKANGKLNKTLFKPEERYCQIYLLKISLWVFHGEQIGVG